MGTTVSFDLRGAADTREALIAACRWLHAVDATFSPYRPASEIARMARGDLRVDQASAEVRTVLTDCARLTHETRGAFDINAQGGLDPSGYVKGWAVERAARILTAHGLENFQINAGGDIVVRGNALPVTGWRIGIRHPEQVDRLATVAHLRDRAIATSGAYERGSHVRDPRTDAPAGGLRSVTVVADDLGTADAWATAIFAWGADGLDLLAAAPPGLEAFVIADDATTARTADFPSLS